MVIWKLTEWIAKTPTFHASLHNHIVENGRGGLFGCLWKAIYWNNQINRLQSESLWLAWNSRWIKVLNRNNRFTLGYQNILGELRKRPNIIIVQIRAAHLFAACEAYLVDFDANHVTPLSPAFFNLPSPLPSYLTWVTQSFHSSSVIVKKIENDHAFRRGSRRMKSKRELKNRVKRGPLF